MKIVKQSLEEQAAGYLRELILSGKYGMGEKLVESALAKDLELSRSTVRMALNTLAHEGLVVQKPYVGWQVINITENDLWELYHLRVALETRSAWLAAEHITEEGKTRLHDLMDYYLQVGRSEGVTCLQISKLELELHTLIIELSGNMRLHQIYRNVANQMLIYFNIDHASYDPEESALSHLPLVEAICAGESGKALKLAEENITVYSVIGHKFREQHLKRYSEQQGES
ncbi:GntR family transcriptional regulator [Photobacterium proteolyticum]|uniref:GntR family transcriptional regulator n=1 Tax=Photobacterium proteolyticum TaxID=1903952 RepID=A0A1Q9GCP4_9GAMM|nr:MULTISPECIES: GntR family transcriptional regulator [Photobacterium]MCG7587376.1 GntR family transcriptional regulator [Photobacterium sp. OFAV2-7]OLQ72167.1 GntR family transcriptional regulator [Photobacterium proteolyticum]